MQIFGKSAMDLNPLIAQGSDGIAKLTEEAKKMGAVMSEEQLEKLGAFDDSIQRLKSGSEAAKNALGLILLPQLQSLATDGISLLGQFTSGLINAGDDWSKISGVIGNAIGGIADMALQGLPKIASVGSQIVLSLVNAFSANMPAVITAATQLMSALIDGFTQSLPQISQGAVTLVLALVQGIINNLPALVQAAATMQSQYDEFSSSYDDFKSDYADFQDTYKEVQNIAVSDGNFTVTYVDGSMETFNYTVDSAGRMRSITRVV